MTSHTKWLQITSVMHICITINATKNPLGWLDIRFQFDCWNGRSHDARSFSGCGMVAQSRPDCRPRSDEVNIHFILSFALNAGTSSNGDTLQRT